MDLPKRGVVRAHLGEGRKPWASAIARTHYGEIAALVGYRTESSRQAYFRVGFYGLSDPAPSRAVNLIGASGAPETVAVMSNGSIWVSGGSSTSVFDPVGKLTAVVTGSGLALSGGFYLTGGATPALYDSAGRHAGQIGLAGGATQIRLLAAGPDGAILACGNQQVLPRDWRNRVEFIDVYRFDNGRRDLTLNDRVPVPAEVLQRSRDGVIRDGTPIHSYFPLEGADFDENGSIVLTELTSAECNFYLCRRLRAEEPWEAKFAYPDDLNREEFEIARAEWRLRAGVGRAPAELAKYFDAPDWQRKPKVSPSERAEVAARRLDPALSRRQ